MDTYAYASGMPKDMIWGMGATPANKVADLFKHQFVSFHVRAAERNTGPIHRYLLSRMPKGGSIRRGV